MSDGPGWQLPRNCNAAQQMLLTRESSVLTLVRAAHLAFQGRFET